MEALFDQILQNSCLNESTFSLSDSFESAEFSQIDALFGGEADLETGVEWRKT